MEICMKTSFLSSRMKSLRADKLLIAFLLCVFLVMLLFNFLSPLSADDFNCSFSFAGEGRITNPLMIFRSMAAHRNTLNGRVFSHALAQFFLMLPKALFNFFNSLNAAFLLTLIYIYIYIFGPFFALRASGLCQVSRPYLLRRGADLVLRPQLRHCFSLA